MSSVATIRYQEAATLEIEALRRWAHAPEPLSEVVLARFFEVVEKGLNREKKESRAHAKRYIRKMLFEIEKEVTLRNEWIQEVRKGTGPALDNPQGVPGAHASQPRPSVNGSSAGPRIAREK